MTKYVLKIESSGYKTASQLIFSSHRVPQRAAEGEALFPTSSFSRWSSGRPRRAQLGKVSPTDAYFATDAYFE